MARHRLLAVISIASGLANVVLSIVLVRRLGLTGIALGTLIPTSVECLLIILPYSTQVIGVSVRALFIDVVLPTLGPAIPMMITLYAIQQTLAPSSLLSIALVGSAGVLIYVIGYLSIGASTVERQTCRNFAHSTIRLTTELLRRPRSAQ
jgi:peptidoglycan biosynthesis protein MviN/MurJ (putative lipid II flippase)